VRRGGGAGIFSSDNLDGLLLPGAHRILITVASIVAFVGLMRATAGVDWEGRL
jgi:hypothetical protein